MEVRNAFDSSTVMVFLASSREDARSDSSVSLGMSPLADPSSLKKSRARVPESTRSAPGEVQAEQPSEQADFCQQSAHLVHLSGRRGVGQT